MSLQFLICRPVVITIQMFFSVFSWIIFPLIFNWWYVFFICGIVKVIIGGVIMNWCTLKTAIWFDSFGSITLMCSCGLMSNIFNEFLSKVDIKFLPSKSIELSGNVFDDWNWVLFLTEESFWLILHNENGMVIPQRTELDEPFSGVEGSFKLYVDKLIPIRDLLPWKTSESVGYDIVRSYE